MHIQDDELRLRMAARTDNELRGIVRDHDGEYTAAATEAAKHELADREASGRQVVDAQSVVVDAQSVEEEALPKPVYVKFIGRSPLTIRAFFWFCVAHVVVAIVALVGGTVMVVGGASSFADLWSEVWTFTYSVPIACAIIVAIRMNHRHLRALLIAATSIYIAQYVLDCVLTSDYTIAAANVLIVPGLWYLVRSRDFAEYEQRIQVAG